MEFKPAQEQSKAKLILSLKAILADAKARGVHLSGYRDDLLDCHECGVYEDILDEKTNIITVHDQGKIVHKESFIIIDRVEKCFRRNSVVHYKITYSYICSVCGTYQSCDIKEKF